MESEMTVDEGFERSDDHATADSAWPPQKIKQRHTDAASPTFTNTVSVTERTPNEVDQVRMTSDSGIGQSASLAKYRPSRGIPTFDTLHRDGVIILSDPAPGRLQFPRSQNSHGEGASIKAMFVEPQKRILPVENEPLWKQMLDYCQRWGPWVALVEDEQRRTELMKWVTVRMKDAWETGINLGHCGDPTGHSTCCLAHASSGEHSSGRKRQKENRKRIVNVDRQPAPFTSDGSKCNFAILNEELDKVGISMDTILERLASGVEAGKELLQDMTSRLDGRAITHKDWTTVQSLHQFNSRTYKPRNLFMFCLWEVQRCHEAVDRAKKALDRPNITSNQQSIQQKRINIFQQRADQHLALALEIDDRENADRSQSEEQEESEFEIDNNSEQLRRSQRTVKSATIVEIPDDDNSRVDSDENDDKGTRYTVTISDERDEEGAHSPVLDHPGDDSGISEEDSDDDSEVSSTVSSRSKRDLEASEYTEEPESKRLKLIHNAHLEQVNHNNYNQGLQEPVAVGALDHYQYSLAPAQNMQFSGMGYHGSPSTSIMPYGNTPTFQRSSQNQAFFEQRMQAYMAQRGQKAINDLLEYNHRPPLVQALKSWSQIRSVSEHLGLNAIYINQQLRSFQSDFQRWERTTLSQAAQYQNIPFNTRAQRPPVPTAQQVLTPTPPTGPTSHEHMEATGKGLSFRFFTSTTKSEQERTDEAIMKYYNEILENKFRRFGYYAVFCDPRDPTREIAHGFWNLTKDRRPDDAAWFYENAPRPANFRGDQEVFNITCGYALPPPKTRKPRATRKVECDDNDASATNRKRRSYKIDDDSDDDYRPGSF